MDIALLSRKYTAAMAAKDNLINKSDIETTHAVGEALCMLGYSVEIISPDSVGNIIRMSCDLAFNACDDGFYGESSLEPHIPALLEVLGIPCTGSNYFTLALCLNKPLTKQLLLASGIRTPLFQVFQTGSEKLNPSLKFPLIVKPSREDASIGITDASVIRKKEHLVGKVRSVIDGHNQPALVEEYIEGREFNVGLLGTTKPLVLPLSEIIFNLPDGMSNICSFEAKWDAGHAAYRGTQPQCPAVLSKKLRSELYSMALKAYNLVGCRDYGRVDFRVDRFGTPYVLEVNPNPDINPTAGLANMASKAGMSYAQLIGAVVKSCMGRNNIQPRKKRKTSD
jgi:D-alanine-D-alanine ligase